MTANGARRLIGEEADQVDELLSTIAFGGPLGPLPLVDATTLELAIEPESVKTARDFAGVWLRSWGLGAMCEDVGLVVSELVTNAVRYGSSARSHARLVVSLLRANGRLTCAVSDPSDEVPVRKKPDFVAQTGRGLHLVEAFSDSWSWMSLHDRGKIVWACFLI